ncbi:MAG: hypothetical protein Q7R65_00035 [bacterium]|nr:hypothetical protein [bacterium]
MKKLLLATVLVLWPALGLAQDAENQFCQIETGDLIIYFMHNPQIYDVTVQYKNKGCAVGVGYKRYDNLPRRMNAPWIIYPGDRGVLQDLRDGKIKIIKKESKNDFLNTIRTWHPVRGR